MDYINTLAREWFGLRANDQPNLERLLRRVRPPDDFLNVCAAPGQKRLNLNGRQVEATSYQVPGAYPQMLVSLRGMDFLPALQAGDKEAVFFDPEARDRFRPVRHLQPGF